MQTAEAPFSLGFAVRNCQQLGGFCAQMELCEKEKIIGKCWEIMGKLNYTGTLTIMYGIIPIIYGITVILIQKNRDIL